MSDSSNQLMPLSLSAPGVNLGAYISTVNQIPILTAEQEKELAEKTGIETPVPENEIEDYMKQVIEEVAKTRKK